MIRTWLLLLAMISIPGTALAHVDLDDPPMRSGGDQKQNPCANASPSSTRTEYVGGSTITVSWTETINHPGYFLISLDPNGDSFDGDGDGVGDHPESPNASGFSSGDGALVLLQVEDTNSAFGGKLSAEVTLPDIDCDQCTLQLIQMMSDKTPTSARPTDHIYFRCADIKIVGTGAGPGPDEPVQAGGAPGTGGEGNAPPAPSGVAGAGGSELTAGGSSGDVVPTSTAVPIPVPTGTPPSDPNPPTEPTSPPAVTTTPAPSSPAPTTTPAPTSAPTTPAASPTGTPGPGVGGAPGAAAPPTEDTSSGGGDDGGCSISAVPRATLHSAWILVFGALWAVRRRVRAAA